MALEIKHVAELSHMYFRIPAYQRGYRWEKKQIYQLLDDLLEFSICIENAKESDELDGGSKHISEVGFYCLQPLAIMPKIDENGGKVYEVIDGQQRLTTLYLIISWLSAHEVKNPYQGGPLDSLRFHIGYDSRSDKFFNEELFKSNNSDARENIDYYFMAMAYETINEWFELNSDYIDNIRELLFPKLYHKYEDQKRDKLLHDVRFVWYEVAEAKSSIPTFNDLNYGKIQLTSTELIKALLMQNTHNSDSSTSSNIQKSMEWSIMEEALQDTYFWAMLNPGEGGSDIHMELVLDFVAEDLFKHHQDIYKDKLLSRNDEYWSYLVVNEYITSGKKSAPMHIEEVWRTIKKVFNAFSNWYQNREYYHLIGLLMLYILRKNKNKKANAITESRECLQDIYDLYMTHLKKDFIDGLRKFVSKYSAITSTSIEGTDGKPRKKTLKEICYGEDDEDIRRVLLLYCVEQSILQDQNSDRFPFHLIDKYQVYSLEHIHAQHLNDLDADFKDLSEWYIAKKNVLYSHLELQEVKDNLSKLTEAITFLDNIFSQGEKKFNDEKDKCVQALSVVDEIYDSLSKMDSKTHMHTLYNMALVDKNVNAALSNNLLDVKRSILRAHATARPETTYVPLGTWHAFNKHFSESVSNMKFWTEKDRIAYFNEIERVYNKYHN